MLKTCLLWINMIYFFIILIRIDYLNMHFRDLYQLEITKKVAIESLMIFINSFIFIIIANSHDFYKTIIYNADFHDYNWCITMLFIIVWNLISIPYILYISQIKILKFYKKTFLFEIVVVFILMASLISGASKVVFLIYNILLCLFLPRIWLFSYIVEKTYTTEYIMI